MSAVPRKPFVFWCSSKPDVKYARTKGNIPEKFVVQLPNLWKFTGSWSVQVQAVYTPKTSTAGDLLLYSDIISYELVGHVYVPLLERITASSDGFLQPEHPFVRRLNQDFFADFAFKIADVNGRPPVWRTTQDHVSLALLFSPEEDSERNDIFMEQTFLSKSILGLFQ